MFWLHGSWQDTGHYFSNIALKLSVNCSAAHERCGWAKAAAGSRTQGSAASPAGETRGSQTVTAGMQCVRDQTSYSMNSQKSWDSCTLLLGGAMYGGAICESTKVTQGRVSVSRWTLVPEQIEGLFSWMVSHSCLSIDQRCLQSIMCLKAIIVSVRVMMIV